MTLTRKKLFDPRITIHEQTSSRLFSAGPYTRRAGYKIFTLIVFFSYLFFHGSTTLFSLRCSTATRNLEFFFVLVRIFLNKILANTNHLPYRCSHIPYFSSIKVKSFTDTSRWLLNWLKFDKSKNYTPLPK